MVRTKKERSKSEKDYTKVSVTIPNQLMKEIDEKRGDIPRTKYLLRLMMAGQQKQE